MQICTPITGLSSAAWDTSRCTSIRCDAAQSVDEKFGTRLFKKKPDSLTSTMADRNVAVMKRKQK